MAGLLYRLGRWCANRGRRRRGLARPPPGCPAAGVACRRRDEQRPAPARDREPAGDGSPGQPLPATAERQQPVRLPRRQGQDHRQGQPAGRRVGLQGAVQGAARPLGPGPVRQRRLGAGEQGRDDRVHPRPAGHPQRRRHRGARRLPPRHHRPGAEGRRRRGRRGQPRRRPLPFADREQRGHRPARGHADPGAHLREPGRDGHAHHHRRGRPGHRAGPHRPARSPVQAPHRGADAGHHDRPGRRHRLRVVPGHQASRPAGRRRRAARVDRPGGRDLRRRHRVRRRHRDHRPPLPAGGRHPPGGVARLRQRGRRVHGRAGGHHAPARGPVAGRAAPVRGQAAGLPPPPAEPGAATFWSRWAATVTGHPLACGLVALALPVPLVVPMLSLHLGQEDVGAPPEATTERQAFDLLASRYGPATTVPW
jgi:hypothetical protein